MVKLQSKLWSLLLAGGAIVSCSEVNDFAVTQAYLKDVVVRGEDFECGDELTRTLYTVDASGFHFSWENGDTIGIYPLGGNQVDFPISSGDGSASATFDGGAWALRSSYTYAAYYPFSSKNFHVKETSLPVSYLGQKQIGNGSLTHLGRYDFNAAAAATPNTSGGVNLQMKHLGCFVRLQLNMPQADSYLQVSLTCKDPKFITKGTFDLSASTPAIVATEMSETVSLELENVSTAATDETITLYLMMAPTNLSGNEITVSVKNTSGFTYMATVPGKNMLVGKAYNYAVPEFTHGTNVDGEDVDWGDTDPFNGHEYVDLGLSVLWGTCNIGANSPSDVGEDYAWGEVETKSSFSLSNYKWYDSTTKTYTKYNSVDNKKVLDLADDVASVKWGGNWRIPTSNEQGDLLLCCSWTLTTQNGHLGYLVIGPNGNSIFLPMKTYSASYWSSTMSTEDNVVYKAYYMSLDDEEGVDWDDCYRYSGLLIRPVVESKSFVPVSSISITTAKNELMLGESQQLSADILPVNASTKNVRWSSSKPEVVSVTQDGVIKAEKVGDAQIYAYALDGSGLYAKKKIIVAKYMDLGLPSGLKWAIYNVGATSPEQYGKYYAWGETSPKNSSSDTYFDSDYSEYNITSGKIVLDLAHDAAHVNWGGDWRMPTEEEFAELRSNCSQRWTSVNGVYGYNLTGPNGNSIFLPAAGYFYSSASDAGSYGSYWTSSLGSQSTQAKYIYFRSSYMYSGSTDRSLYGRSVRAVCP